MRLSHHPRGEGLPVKHLAAWVRLAAVRTAALVRLACAVAAVVALAGCGTGGYTANGNQGAGKVLFVKACGTCHTLAAAGTAGTIGPNLDNAFAASREVGMKSSTFRQVVHDQIMFPISKPSTGAPGMPKVDTTLPPCSSVQGSGFCVKNQDQAAADIATYVGNVAGTGATAPPSGGGGGATDGKQIFQTAGCANCHTLKDAGSTGTVGPNLDQAKPPKSLVVDRVTNGKSVMPSFKGSLSPQQIQAVADYVSSVAGK
jgi:mono/diheme cytochrome c family protein